MKQNKENLINQINLSAQENNAIFIAARKVVSFPMDFHHLFVVVIMKNLYALFSEYPNRIQQFYDFANAKSQKPKFFNNFDLDSEIIWGTTISGTSECAFAPEKVEKDLGRLISVPNYDRTMQKATGELVYTKKIAYNNIDLIRKAFDFEAGYKNDKKYGMFPSKRCSSYNSNSFIRGLIEYMKINENMVLPKCFKAPGFSKVLTIN